MQKGRLIYEGKAKKVYAAVDSKGNEDSKYCIMVFKDDLTAGDGAKFDIRQGKGRLNTKITATLFSFLETQGIATHFEKKLSECTLLTRKTTIFPVEVVTRNIVSGSLEKRLGLSQGTVLDFPVVEFYYKNDLLHDPLLNSDHILVLGLAEKEALAHMTEKAKQINYLLWEYFDAVKLTLVDFKLEFGRTDTGHILLADEITPDTCRLWDYETKQSMDKDVFRQGTGDVLNGYREVCRRILEEGDMDV